MAIQPLKDSQEADPPRNIEVLFTERGKLLHAFHLSLTDVHNAVVPEVGSRLLLGNIGTFDVVKSQYEYINRLGTASPMLGRITLMLKKASKKK